MRRQVLPHAPSPTGDSEMTRMQRGAEREGTTLGEQPAGHTRRGRSVPMTSLRRRSPDMMTLCKERARTGGQRRRGRAVGVSVQLEHSQRSPQQLSQHHHTAQREQSRPCPRQKEARTRAQTAVQSSPAASTWSVTAPASTSASATTSASAAMHTPAQISCYVTSALVSHQVPLGLPCPSSRPSSADARAPRSLLPPLRPLSPPWPTIEPRTKSLRSRQVSLTRLAPRTTRQRPSSTTTSCQWHRLRRLPRTPL